MAAGAVFFLLAAACAPPPKTVAVISPTSSPSPTPADPLVAASLPSFHTGEVGVGYAPVAFSATGGRSPYSWTVSSGALPGGLNLGSDGSISGTPSAAGTFTFTVQVADSGDSTARVGGKITVAASLVATLIPACQEYCNVELGCASACGSFGSLSGGVGPYTYSVAQGPLPAGTSLSGLALAGTFVGQPGWLQFKVQVSDALGATATIAPRFWMYPHISLAGGVCYGNYGTGCSVQLPVSGGTPGAGMSVKLVAVGANPNQGCWNPQAAPPPAGYVLTASGGSVVVSIPKGLINGYGGVWTVAVTSTDPCGSPPSCVSGSATVTIGVQCG